MYGERRRKRLHILLSVALILASVCLQGYGGTEVKIRDGAARKPKIARVRNEPKEGREWVRSSPINFEKRLGIKAW